MESHAAKNGGRAAAEVISVRNQSLSLISVGAHKSTKSATARHTTPRCFFFVSKNWQIKSLESRRTLISYRCEPKLNLFRKQLKHIKTSTNNFRVYQRSYWRRNVCNIHSSTTRILPLSGCIQVATQNWLALAVNSVCISSVIILLIFAIVTIRIVISLMHPMRTHIQWIKSFVTHAAYLISEREIDGGGECCVRCDIPKWIHSIG